MNVYEYLKQQRARTEQLYGRWEWGYPEDGSPRSAADKHGVSVTEWLERQRSRAAGTTRHNAYMPADRRPLTISYLKEKP